MLATASWLKAQIMMIYVKYKGHIAEMHIKLGADHRQEPKNQWNWVIKWEILKYKDLFESC